MGYGCLLLRKANSFASRRKSWIWTVLRLEMVRKEVFMQYIKLFNAENEREADLLLTSLKSEGIACYAQDAGAGGYLTITSGFSVFGKDIYVEQRDQERARAILQDIQAGWELESEEYHLPWYRNRVIVLRIYLVLVVLMFLGILGLNLLF